MSCRCESCTDTPAPTYTEQFRHEKEVEYVAQQSEQWIKSFLDGVKQKRGEAAWLRLRKDVIEAWKNLAS